MGFNYCIRKKDATIELYIDRGKDSEEENKAIFDKLFELKNAIEETFGDSLEWQRLEGKRACRIMKQIALGGYKDEAQWPELQDAMIDAMIRLAKALKPYIAKL